MDIKSLQVAIEGAWEDRNNLSPATQGAARNAVNAALDLLDGGTVRVAEKGAKGWSVNQWLKKAVLLGFRLNDMAQMPGLAGAAYWDKVPLKTTGWSDAQFKQAGFRAVPGSVVR